MALRPSPLSVLTKTEWELYGDEKESNAPWHISTLPMRVTKDKEGQPKYSLSNPVSKKFQPLSGCQVQLLSE